VIAEVAGQMRFCDGLLGIADYARNHYRFVAACRGDGFPGCLHCQFEDRAVQADLRVVNGELRSVHAYGHAARSGGEIVTGQSLLATLIDTVIRPQGQRMSGYDAA
jgi:hypothetical protein